MSRFAIESPFLLFSNSTILISPKKSLFNFPTVSIISILKFSQTIISISIYTHFTLCQINETRTKHPITTNRTKPTAATYFLNFSLLLLHVLTANLYAYVNNSNKPQNRKVQARTTHGSSEIAFTDATRRQSITAMVGKCNEKGEKRERETWKKEKIPKYGWNFDEVRWIQEVLVNQFWIFDIFRYSWFFPNQ